MILLIKNVQSIIGATQRRCGDRTRPLSTRDHRFGEPVHLLVPRTHLQKASRAHRAGVAAGAGLPEGSAMLNTR